MKEEPGNLVLSTARSREKWKNRPIEEQLSPRMKAAIHTDLVDDYLHIRKMYHYRNGGSHLSKFAKVS